MIRCHAKSNGSGGASTKGGKAEVSGKESSKKKKSISAKNIRRKEQTIRGGIKPVLAEEEMAFDGSEWEGRGSD